MDKSKPRYSRVTNIIELAIFMQTKLQGVSLRDIKEEYSVSRRTAERMRDSVLNLFPQVSEIETGEKVKRWGFTGGFLREIISFSSSEIANLDRIKSIQNIDVNAELIKSVISKIKALSRTSLEKIENELEILLETQGYAVRQSPSYRADVKVLETLVEGIKNSKKISAAYNEKQRRLSPLGLVYNEKIYLVAIEEDKGSDPFYYILHKLRDVKLTDEPFVRGDFNLKNFTGQSFGIFQGKSYDVKLQFAPEVKDDVLNFNFHPTQKIKENKDGTTTVTFKASGEREICWHLFKWSAAVKILAPNELKQEYLKMLEGAKSAVAE